MGCTTPTIGLARACLAVIERHAFGIHHWTDAGLVSSHDLAVGIGELAVAAGVLVCAAPVVPISTADYTITSCRPPYSLLDSSNTGPNFA